MNWRLALVMGVVFAAVGVGYLSVQHFDLTAKDLMGPVLLVLLGIAMAFGFTVLLRGSRDL
jgi:hypothetical protein